MYDLDNPGRGIRDCPRCQRTMELLKRYNAVRRNEGYAIEEDSPNHSRLMERLFGLSGWLLYQFYRHVAQPFAHKRAGEQRQNRYDRILRDHPYTLICPYCGHLLKRK